MDKFDFPAVAPGYCSENASIIVVRGDDFGAQLDSHSEQYYQIRLTAKKLGEVFIGDYRGRCDPGSLFLLGPNLPFIWSGFNPAGDQVGDPGWSVHFSNSWFQRMVLLMPELEALPRLLLRARQGLQFGGQTLQHARKLLMEMAATSGPDRVVLFLQLLECMSGSDQSRSLVTTDYASLNGCKPRGRIQEVVNFLGLHFDQDLSLGSVAERHGMSASYLSRLFKQATGRGFCDYLTDLRIARACELLSGSDLSITDICFDIGFKNISNFNRRFVALKQVTPTEYRRAQ